MRCHITEWIKGVDRLRVSSPGDIRDTSDGSRQVTVLCETTYMDHVTDHRSVSMFGLSGSNVKANNVILFIIKLNQLKAGGDEGDNNKRRQGRVLNMSVSGRYLAGE